jgi:glycosyltransferase involved in cell wall biosynthesis
VQTFGATAVSALTRRRYDIVHALTPTGVLAAGLTRHRCVYTALGHPSLEEFALERGSAATFRAALGSADATVALSASAADRIGAIAAGTRFRRTRVAARRNRRLMRGEGPGNWLRVIPPGVRLDRFGPAGPAATPCRGARVLFASDASEIRKGVHYALAAVGQLRRTDPEARLVLCGPGDAHWTVSGVGSTASAILARRDPLAVTGLGEEGGRLLAEATEAVPGVASEDMAVQYRSATVTVLPSWEEAFGLVLAESLACGTPVVAFEEAGMTDVISRPEVGRLARFGDVDGLARALVETVALAGRPETAAICADHARRWGWAESVGPAYEDLYRSVLGR